MTTYRALPSSDASLENKLLNLANFGLHLATTLGISMLKCLVHASYHHYFILCSIQLNTGIYLTLGLLQIEQLSFFVKKIYCVV